MGTRKIAKSKDLIEPPAAELYLDDISEIVGVLASGAEPGATVSTRFLINDREFDSIEDLKNRGGTTANFEVEVKFGDWRWARVSISRHTSSVWVYDSNPGNRYKQVKEIFERNARWWSNTIRSMPGWLSGTFWMFFIFGGFLFSLLSAVAGRRFPKDKVVELGVSLGVLYVLVIVGTITAYYRHTTVHLYYADDYGVRQWIRRHGSQVVLILLGAVAGAVVRELVQHFWK